LAKVKLILQFCIHLRTVFCICDVDSDYVGKVVYVETLL